MSSVRSFLAIPLPDELKTAISGQQRALALQIPDVRWSHPENLHLTLHFFGETSQETLERVKVSMLSVKRSLRPFTVTVKGFGAFPGLNRPRVVWLGLEPVEELRRLHAACGNSLTAAGMAPEGRRFTPHLTLGRLRHPGGNLTKVAAEFNQKVIGTFRVDHLVLYESRLHPGGAEHSPLYSVNFTEHDSDL